MKKIQVRKDLKVVSLLVCTIAVIGLATLSYFEYKNPGIEEKKISLYSYEYHGDVSYQVAVQSNSLYDTKTLDEDEVYFANLVDSIDTTFNYEFKGERIAEISGTYELIAVVEGYIGEGDERATLWKKQIPLLTKTKFEANDAKFSITQKMPIKLSDYNAFVENVNKESKVNTQARLTTYMNVDLTAKTDKGSIKEKESISLVVPLNASYFRITKNSLENKSKAIEEVITVQRPVRKDPIIGYGVGAGILILVLFLIIFGTQKTEIDPYIKALKKIFKKHGTRLVALETEVEAASEYQIKVCSIEDLVRISDELGKPMIYKQSNIYQNISKFGVIDGDRYFVFDLKETIEYGTRLLKNRVKAPTKASVYTGEIEAAATGLSVNVTVNNQVP